MRRHLCKLQRRRQYANLAHTYFVIKKEEKYFGLRIKICILCHLIKFAYVILCELQYLMEIAFILILPNSDNLVKFDRILGLWHVDKNYGPRFQTNSQEGYKGCTLHKRKETNKKKKIILHKYVLCDRTFLTTHQGNVLIGEPNILWRARLLRLAADPGSGLSESRKTNIISYFPRARPFFHGFPDLKRLRSLY